MITEADYLGKIKEDIARQRESIKQLYGVDCVHVFSGGTKSTVDDFVKLGRTIDEHFSDLMNNQGIAVLALEKRVPNDIARGRDFEYGEITINPQHLVSASLSAGMRDSIEYIAARNRYVPEVGYVGVLIIKRK